MDEEADLEALLKGTVRFDKIFSDTGIAHFEKCPEMKTRYYNIRNRPSIELLLTCDKCMNTTN